MPAVTGRYLVAVVGAGVQSRQCGDGPETNQPEAMAFYRSLGYREFGREHQPGWSWTLVYYLKEL
jgi:hypothetical protein